MNWADAKSYCEVKGGNLVVLDSVEKHQDTVDFIQKYCKYVKQSMLKLSYKGKTKTMKLVFVASRISTQN